MRNFAVFVSLSNFRAIGPGARDRGRGCAGPVWVKIRTLIRVFGRAARVSSRLRASGL